MVPSVMTNEWRELLPSLTPQERAEIDNLVAAAEAKPREFEFRGAAKQLIDSDVREICISGMARTGKSMAALYKLHKLASDERIRGMRGLIIRKTRESLNESALLTFERDVLGLDSSLIPQGQRNSRHTYHYPNGSEIIVAGLLANGKDQKAKVMSTEYDIIFVQEATEILEEEYQKLTTRLSNFRTPYQQIILDCNPDAPSHWIYRRSEANKLLLVKSFLQDNPRWWSLENGGHWTPDGQNVYNTLDGLTGVMRDRLFLGLWVQASGLIYGDVWADGPLDGNVTEQAEYVAGAGPILWAVDDGYAGEYDASAGQFTAQSHPRVFLLCQLRQNGQLCVFVESYAVKELSDAHIAKVLALGYPRPDFAAVDKSAAELRGRLHALNIYTRNGPPSVDESIKNLRDFLAADKNGFRRIVTHPRVKHLRAEMVAYKADETTGKPVKAFDHGPDAIRYLAWALRYNQ